MKKLFSILMALIMIVPVYADVQQSVNKALLKAQKKEAKKKEKQYKKTGWEIVGSRTMEVSLLRHYTKLNELGDNGVEFSGISTKTKSKNLGEQMALNAATVKYAQKAGSTVKGRVISNMQHGEEMEFEKFYAAYERLVEQNVKEVLVPSYTIIKNYDDGSCEVQAFYIVDESKALNARKTALEGAIKESELAGKYADTVRGFINERIED